MKGFPLVIVALFIDGLIAGFGLVIWAGFLGLGTTVAGLASWIPYAGPMLGATAGAAVNGAGIGVAFVTSVCINATLGAGFATALPYMYGGTTAQTHRLMTRFLRWMLAKLIPGLGYLPLWTVGTVWFLWDEHKEAKKFAEKGQNISVAEEGEGERETVPGQISRLSPAGIFAETPAKRPVPQIPNTPARAPLTPARGIDGIRAPAGGRSPTLPARIAQPYGLAA